ncbi:NADP(H)-dependent aldo-keto reductase [Escherichia coli]|nr:NADP(H)-dependent aldo-keto reductase [Escherichia coli]EEX4207670.1 NADP(H)-dependent aldo-keto reductase [Escherichia coli]
MQYHRIPHSSLEVSTLGLGTMTFGEQNSEADAHAQLDYAVAQGINLIDVAEMYPVPPRPETQGLTETYVGNWLAKHGSREKLIIASKVSGPSRPETQGLTETYVGNWLAKHGSREKLIIASKVSGPSRNNDKGIRPDQALDRKNIREALHDSLKRLQTDYLDLYQVHWPQRPTNCFGKLGYSWTDSAPAVSLLDTLDALAEYQRAGKIRYIGVSNETAFGVMRYLHLADKHDLPRIVTIQNPYSLLNRSFEVGLAEVSQYEGVELLAYSCLGFGTLTGKYLNGAKPAGARNTLFSRFTRYSGEQTQKAVAAYVDIARRHGLAPAQMALAFVRRQPFVASTLLGATTMDQLKTNIESLHLELSEDVLAEIEAVHQVYTYPAP